MAMRWQQPSRGRVGSTSSCNGGVRSRAAVPWLHLLIPAIGGCLQASAVSGSRTFGAGYIAPHPSIRCAPLSGT